MYMYMVYMWYIPYIWYIYHIYGIYTTYIPYIYHIYGIIIHIYHIYGIHVYGIYIHVHFRFNSTTVHKLAHVQETSTSTRQVQVNRLFSLAKLPAVHKQYDKCKPECKQCSYNYGLARGIR